ncbi:MAG: tetratricopeptide (TPR) repeat protein [Planctomycetota bacterium]|jgi:tetratricopeptide (TPR) repeat protein
MMLRVLLFGTLLLSGALAQGPVRGAAEPPAKPNAQKPNAQKPVAQKPVAKKPVAKKPTAQKPVAKSAVPKSMAPELSSEAKIAFRDARKLEKDSRKASGPARSRKLELAASAYDRLVAKFEAEPQVAAQAAWYAAELWRRHGSAPLAEKDYLFAAKQHAVRYGQRGLLAAADMQRRQLRTEDAMTTYAQAEVVDARTGHAQTARLWMARMLLSDGKVDLAIERFQGALESAPSPRRAIDAADYLAKAWIIKGDLDSAGFVIDHAEKVVHGEKHGDPIVAERLRRAFERMGAKKALERALDEKHGAAKDAVRLDEHRRSQAGK